MVLTSPDVISVYYVGKGIYMQKKTRDNMVYIAVMFLTGVVCGIFGVRQWLGGTGQSVSAGQEIVRLVFLLFFLYVGFWIQMIIHEAGHLVFGLLSGYSFSSFRIGSVMLTKKGKKLEWKQYSLMRTGGQCLMVPPNDSLEKIPYVLYNMGGVIANAVASMILVWIAKVLPSSGIRSGICMITAIAGLGSALMNGIPLHMEMIDNDGANTVSISKSEEAKRCFVSQMYINAYTTKGMRLKDMPDMWFRIPDEESRKNALCAANGVFACLRAIDQMDFEKARKIGYQMIGEDNGMAGIYRQILQAEMMYCEMIREKQSGGVEQLKTKELDKFLKTMKKNPSVQRIEYVYHLLELHDEEEARKDLERFEQTAKTYPNECEIEGERELIAYAREIFEKRSAG